MPKGISQAGLCSPSLWLPSTSPQHSARAATISEDVRQASFQHTRQREAVHKRKSGSGSLKPLASSVFILLICLIRCCRRSELTATLQENQVSGGGLTSTEGSAACCVTLLDEVRGRCAGSKAVCQSRAGGAWGLSLTDPILPASGCPFLHSGSEAPLPSFPHHPAASPPSFPGPLHVQLPLWPSPLQGHIA